MQISAQQVEFILLLYLHAINQYLIIEFLSYKYTLYQTCSVLVAGILFLLIVNNQCCPSWSSKDNLLKDHKKGRPVVRSFCFCTICSMFIQSDLKLLNPTKRKKIFFSDYGFVFSRICISQKTLYVENGNNVFLSS